MNNWITEKAPAKLNLTLHVTGQRPDGYHTLESLVAFAQVSDEISARAASSDSLTIVGPFSTQITSDQSNLVLRAVAAFRASWPNKLPGGLEIKLTKNLPVAAGIGGGSSDAAAMLRIMAQLTKAPTDPAELLNVAAHLGADVPVCLQTMPRIISGVGELLGPPLPLPEIYAVLVNPLKATATNDVFARLKHKDNPDMPTLPEKFANASDLAEWLKTTRNDLVQAACELTPDIAEIIEILQENPDCLLARMSGSGATVFALFATSERAEKTASALGTKWPDYWVVSSRLLEGTP